MLVGWGLWHLAPASTGAPDPGWALLLVALGGHEPSVLFCFIYLLVEPCLLFNSMARVSENMINLGGHLIM